VSRGEPVAGERPADDDACWQEAARLRREHSAWVVIWLAREREFRAYRRMPGARRDTILSASTPDDLAAMIVDAEVTPPSAPSDR
jgi:hypothetical protein